MDRPPAKLKEKEALRSLCLISDPTHTGKVSWKDFRVFLNRCRIHINEDTLKGMETSGNVKYIPVLDRLDFDTRKSCWVLRPGVRNSQTMKPLTRRKDLLGLM